MRSHAVIPRRTSEVIMSSRPSILVAVALLALSCRRSPTVSTTETTGATVPAADNAKLDQKDKSGAPPPNWEDRFDVETTQRIRNALLNNGSLSPEGQNVRVETLDGVITLRGPVRNLTERHAIEEIARQQAGVNRIDNEMDVISGE
jgi:osmotically-inducible protein OsmY